MNGRSRVAMSATCLMLAGCGPWAASDVPTTGQIGEFAHQNDITITAFTAEVVGSKEVGSTLFLGPGRGLVRMHIVGRLHGPDGRSPYISKVQVAEYFDRPTAPSGSLTADVVVTPVADERDEPRSVFPDSTPFDVKVERVLTVYQWGENVYQFRCGDFEQSVALHSGL